MRRRAAILLLFASAPALAADYYVSASGSGTTCSSGSPCAAAEISNKNLNAGDQVIFTGSGTIKTATATANGVIDASSADDGASGSPVVFKMDTGATAVLTCLNSTALDDTTFVQCTAANDCDGNGNTTDNAYTNVWKVAYATTARGVYETNATAATINVDDRATPTGNCYASCTGSRYTFDASMPYTNATNAAQATNADTCNKLPGCWFQTGGNLYVHLWDSGDPTTAGRDLEVAIAAKFFRFTDVDWVTITGTTIRYCPSPFSNDYTAGTTLTNNDWRGGDTGASISNVLDADDGAVSGSTTITGNTFSNFQKRGDCEANNDACATGLASATTKHDGYTGGASGNCLNIDSGSATAVANVTVSDNVLEKCDNASQMMGLTGPVISGNLFANCTNHALTARPATNGGTCTGYVIEENVFHDCQEVGPYISSCTNGKLIRNGGLSNVNTGINEYSGSSTGWRACGNLFAAGNGLYAETIRTTTATAITSDVNWLPDSATCYFDGTGYSCDPVGGASNDWTDASSQDANSFFTGFSLAGVTFPLANYGTGDYTRADYLPESGSTEVRDRLSDLDCDGDVDGDDTCNEANHCYGSAADLGPFEWGIDVPDASGGRLRRMMVTK